jgi:inner membrane protein involved in colicin E2 resistance
VLLEPGASQTVEVRYRSQGLDAWWYDFGAEVEQVKNFSLVMTTDFDAIDFPPNSISPTSKDREGRGWKLGWTYTNLLSGVQIGMAMPQKLNPGPWVSRVTFTAPVSLFLFFFLLFVIQTRESVKIHPMNYFFLAAAFFAFHLLLAYMVDHVAIHLAFLIASAVSIALVVSYVGVVVGARFALIKVGLAQFVYLVLFSYTFFFEEYTGLAVTVLCVLTLFAVMQYTAKLDWEEVFRGKNRGPA